MEIDRRRPKINFHLVDWPPLGMEATYLHSADPDLSHENSFTGHVMAKMFHLTEKFTCIGFKCDPIQ
jgi:hypothetical protein